jgi:methionyl-tRNA synthetase
MLGYKTSMKHWDDAFLELKDGTSIEKPIPLFKKLDLADIIEESDPFSKLDLRVAKIIDAQDHPQADKLYVLQLELGPLGKRTIVAGMKPYYSKQELIGRSIVIVVNLKPAKIRGIESKGMLLAAEENEKVVSLLDPKNASPGAEIFVEGLPRVPASVVEFDDFKQISLTIGDGLKATYNGKPLKSKTDTVVSHKTVKIGSAIH